MSCDKLVFDLSQEVEGSPNVFIRKDWLNILDNQNQNYQNNQSIIDTSQLANSNKYMAYREGYLAVPMLLTMKGTTTGAFTQVGKSMGDFSIGLKNWFGTIIHSMTLDYNGTTIVQQTPYCNMWNSFKLMTTLSWGDIITQGPTIGFYPDDSGSWAWLDAYTTAGVLAQNNVGLNVCNNTLTQFFSPFTSDQEDLNSYNQSTGFGLGGNEGLSSRIKWIAYDSEAGGSSYGTGTCSRPFGSWTPALQAGTNAPAYSPFVGRPAQYANQLWFSNISYKTPPTTPGANAIYANGTALVLQISVMATIHLKHIHSFFNMCPLLKGVFMKMTMNLNNATSTVTTAGQGFAGYTSNVFVGGVNPLMIPSFSSGLTWMTTGAFNAGTNSFTLAAGAPTTLQYNISVGSTCTDSSLQLAPTQVGNVSKSVYLYIPAYTFNPTFEQAYLSNNIKQIKYTDIYQYQVKGIPTNTPFNNLITNGIANIKSVLIIPFFSLGYANNTTAGVIPTQYVEFQSPFDPAGTGPTAPMVSLGNFNVQISGQNAIYNMQRYSFEEWNNQLYGQNAVNGGLTDGLTSGLISFSDFQNSYCYYYVNVERMLPVEQSVPKSVQILGTNYSTQMIDLWVFIEYGVQVSIDVLTGARV